MTIEPSRRIFLRNSALALAGGSAAPGWGVRAGRATTVPAARRKVLVTIFQRGGADGLNMVVPHGEKAYYELRPTIAIPRPTRDSRRKGDAAIDLDGFFGLHPALVGLAAVFEGGHLAIVHAVGSPDNTRSHLDGQAYMESGTPGRKTGAGGWMARALPQRGGLEAGLERRIYRAPWDRLEEADGAGTPRTSVGRANERGHGVPGDAGLWPARAGYPDNRFGRSMRRIARLIQSDAGVEVASADIGGWDHHVNAGGARPGEGLLAGRLREYGQGLHAFWADLGERGSDVVVVTMSEFGRCARENGTRGTDHGHGYCMLVMGGAVKGGKVYGRWPGLAREQLHEGRSLAVTTDFRDVLGELVARHLGHESAETVFPGHVPEFPGLV